MAASLLVSSTVLRAHIQFTDEIVVVFLPITHDEVYITIGSFYSRVTCV